MRGTLTRLRLGFLLLGAALLAPLFVLLRSVESRLEAQRHLRHEIVAERIFDEMERELTALLAREGERPSDAYDVTQTRVETWAPFVVGYFTRDAAGLRVIARDQLTPERAARVERAVERTLPPTAATKPGLDTALERRRSAGELEPAQSREHIREKKAVLHPPATRAAEGAGTQPKRPLAQKSLPEAVLRQLNRAADERDPQSKTRSAPTPIDSLDSAEDPLNGL
jgi:hypothetical protein